MKKITLNELPAWSSWPKRLLGLSEWVISKRDTSKVEKEYNLDKYAKCLEFLENSSPQATAEQVKTFELGPDAEDVCVSVGDDLGILPLKEARKRYYEIIADHIGEEIEEGMTVVELGSGYGYNLWMLSEKFNTKKCQWWGGDYSSKAVDIGKILWTEKFPHISVQQFNFYDADYQLPEGNKLLVYTAHTIEQLPDASNVITALEKHRSRIKAVIHFEPGYELQDESLLGLMRKRYFEVNDYNRNLISELKKRSENITIVDIKPNIFGLNPVNPTSVVKWKFE